MAESQAQQDEALARGAEQARVAQENFLEANKRPGALLTDAEKLAALRLGIERALRKPNRAAAMTYNPLYVEGERDALRSVLAAMKEMGA